MSYKLEFTAATLNDGALHFPSTGKGSFTSTAAGTGTGAVYSRTGATGITSVPGTAGDRGYCFTSGGWFANYVVVVAGASGEIAVNMWMNMDPAKIDTIPTGNLTFQRDAAANLGSVIAHYERVHIESIVITAAGTGDTLTITDALGAAVRGIVVASAAPAAATAFFQDGLPFYGPFGFIATAGSQLSGVVLFHGRSYRNRRPLSMAGSAF